MRARERDRELAMEREREEERGRGVVCVHKWRIDRETMLMLRVIFSCGVDVVVGRAMAMLAGLGAVYNLYRR